LKHKKKERISSEASKRNLDLQLNTVRDQLEQEERQRKKLEVQKKQLQLELDDIKELADEAEELKEELSHLKQESEIYNKDLIAEREKERQNRTISEEQAEKMKNEVNEIRKILNDSKNETSSNVRSIRQKYEREISELEDVLNKAKKDKKLNQRGTKKLDRNVRDLSRKLQNSELDLHTSEDKLATLTKEYNKAHDELQSQNRKQSSLEAQNRILQKDSDSLKLKILDLESELNKIKGSFSTTPKRTVGRKVVQEVSSDDDEEEIEN